ncbi:MAG: DUF4330 domain-containing protein [Leptolyngbyaceae bacterium]|nr:DUF4330 domain-containing protein [Leptolyngbyaceae bacterium]
MVVEMAILDSHGRLFGKVSIVDLGAGLLALLVVVGIFLVPGNTGSVAQVGATLKPVEVDVMVRGLTVSEPDALIQSMRDEGQTQIIVRNQPFGTVEIKNVRELPRTVATPQPDGTLRALEDPRPELDFTTDLLVTLADDAEVTNDSVVFGKNSVKIGTQMELEGQTYRFNTTVVGVRILE